MKFLVRPFRVTYIFSLLIFVCQFICTASDKLPIQVDLSKHNTESSIKIKQDGEKLFVLWPAGNGEVGEAIFNLDSRKSLINQLAINNPMLENRLVVIKDFKPLFTLTVGQRNESQFEGVRIMKDSNGVPVHNNEHEHGQEGCNMWMTFFDKVYKREYKSHRLQFKLSNPSVESTENRCVLTFGEIQTTDFTYKGKLQCTIYNDSPLLHFQAIVETQQDRRAIIYDAGISSEKPSWSEVAWLNTQDKFNSASLDSAYKTEAVRHRTIMAKSEQGCLAIFPPPHQFYYPQDNCHNLEYTWYGKNHLNIVPEYSLGIRQDPVGDERFIPWHNSPPGSKQRLSIFFLLSGGSVEDAMKKVQAYTHTDSFIPLPKYKTFSTHFHLAHTVSVMNHEKGSENPEFVDVFRKIGVNILHPGEFHGDGNPRSAKKIRLQELKKLFEEGERLSDEDFLFLPGEEANCHLGGHWMLLFPKPVFWHMKRRASEPFVRNEPGFGKVYRTRNAEDILRMLKAESGLAWTAHARIKGSRGYPDKYKDTDFFNSEHFLGAAWKNLPSDLSRPKLGWRVLDLMDDMANWGVKKYCPSEVDVFKISKTSELYGHMNINYLKLDKLPKYKDGWFSITQALRTGKFFSTTGEVLIPEFTVDGVESGDTLNHEGKKIAKFKASIEWTFPLNFAEIISGDGANVYRQKIDLTDTKEFGKKRIELDIDLEGRKWVRFEVWDVAANGAYTQPIWIK